MEKLEKKPELAVELTFNVGEWRVKRISDSMITISHDSKTYTIDRINKTCSCLDFFYNGYSDPGYVCKHIRYIGPLVGGVDLNV